VSHGPRGLQGLRGQRGQRGVRVGRASVLFVALAVGACLSPGGETAPEQTESAAAGPPVEIAESGDDRVAAVEWVAIDNCVGAKPVDRHLERAAEVRLDPAPRLGARAIEAAVVEHYASDKRLMSAGAPVSLDLTAPPGQHMRFEVEWSTSTFTGTVRSDGRPTGEWQYAYEVPLSVELRSLHDVGCAAVAATSPPDFATAPPRVDLTSVPRPPLRPGSLATIPLVRGTPDSREPTPDRKATREWPRPPTATAILRPGPPPGTLEISPIQVPPTLRP
jgi:hypothetical protein